MQHGEVRQGGTYRIGDTIPSELNLPLSSGIIDWIEDSGVSSTIMVDSFAHGIESLHSIFDEDPGTDSILGLGSTDSTHDVLKGIGVPLLKQGVVGGMTGVMMGECRRRGIDALAILAESDGEIGQGRFPMPCSSGNNRMLRRTSACSPSGSGTLMEEAQRIEGQIREMMAVHLNPLRRVAVLLLGCTDDQNSPSVDCLSSGSSSSIDPP